MQNDINRFNVPVFQLKVEINIGDSNHNKQSYQNFGVHSHCNKCKVNKN